MILLNDARKRPIFTIETIKTYFRKKMGAFSPPSLLFEDLLDRFLVTVGVGEERAKDGIGLVML